MFCWYDLFKNGEDEKLFSPILLVGKHILCVNDSESLSMKQIFYTPYVCVFNDIQADVSWNGKFFWQQRQWQHDICLTHICQGKIQFGLFHFSPLLYILLLYYHHHRCDHRMCCLFVKPRQCFRLCSSSPSSYSSSFPSYLLLLLLWSL